MDTIKLIKAGEWSEVALKSIELVSNNEFKLLKLIYSTSDVLTCKKF